MGFTVRTTADDEKAIDVIKEAFGTTKKGEALLKCAHEHPELKQRIHVLEQEVYRLQRIESEQKRIKSFFKELVS